MAISGGASPVFVFSAGCAELYVLMARSAMRFTDAVKELAVSQFCSFDADRLGNGKTYYLFPPSWIPCFELKYLVPLQPFPGCDYRSAHKIMPTNVRDVKRRLHKFTVVLHLTVGANSSIKQYHFLARWLDVCRR